MILFTWDGVPRVRPDGSNWFHEVIDGTSILSLMGGHSVDKGVEINNMYCTIPSSTFPSNARISKAETNIPFVIFYPGDGAISVPKSRFESHLSGLGKNPYTGFWSTTDLIDIIDQTVINSNQILMSNQ